MESKEQHHGEHLAMIAAWQQSGQSQKQYCLQNNVAYHKFHYWYKVYRDQQSAGSGSFVALNITSPTQGNLELHLVDGRRIIFHQPVSVEFLKALIA
jgi:hypothetical protein